MTMRLKLPVVAAAVALVVAAPTAFGSHGRDFTKCGGKMSILVWPHGHGVIPSVSFPAIVNPPSAAKANRIAASCMMHLRLSEMDARQCPPRPAEKQSCRNAG